MRIRRWLPGGCSSGPTGSDRQATPGPGLLDHQAWVRRPGAGPGAGGRTRQALLGLSQADAEAVPVVRLRAALALRRLDERPELADDGITPHRSKPQPERDPE